MFYVIIGLLFISFIFTVLSDKKYKDNYVIRRKLMVVAYILIAVCFLIALFC